MVTHTFKRSQVKLRTRIKLQVLRFNVKKREEKKKQDILK